MLSLLVLHLEDIQIYFILLNLTYLTNQSMFDTALQTTQHYKTTHRPY